MVKLIKTAPNNDKFPVWLIVVLGLMILCVLAGGIWLYQTKAQQLKQKAITELEFIAKMKAGQIQQWREERLADVNALAANRFFMEGIVDCLVREDPDAAQKVMTSFEGINKYYHYRDVFLVDASGEVRLSLHKAIDRITADDLTRLKKAFADQKPFINDLHFPVNTDSPVIDIMAPIYGDKAEQHKPLGALVLQIDPEQFLYPFLRSLPISSRTGETLLIRREGSQVVFLNVPRHKEMGPLDLKIPLSHKEVPAVAAVLGKEGLFIGKDYRGHEVLSVLLSIPNSPWHIITKMDTEEAFAQLRFNKWLIVFLTVGLLAAVIAGIGLLWQYMRKLHYKAVYRAETERQALRIHFEHLIKYANDIIFLLDENRQIVDVNDRALEAYGYLRDEMLKLKISNLVAPEDLERHRARMQHIDEKGAILTEAFHIRKNGLKFPVEVSARLIEVNGRKYVQAIVRDISERKLAEETLRKEQEKYRFLTENAPFGMVVVAKDGEFKYINPRFTEIFGYDLTDVSNGKQWFSKAYPDSNYRRHVISAWKTDHEKFKPGEKRPRTYLVRCKNGEDRFVHFIPIQLETGDFLMFCDDITERKRGEDKIRESDERYRALFERSLDCVYLHDFDGKFIDLNDTALNLLGYEHKDIKSLKLVTLLGKDQLPFATKHLEELLKTGYQKDVAEFRLKRKDGHYVYIEAKASIVYQDGRPYAIQGVARDITLRRQAEAIVRDSEARYSIAAQCTGQLIYDYDIVSGKIYWTGAIEAITGYTADEFSRVDIAGWESLIHADDRKEAIELLAESINSAAQYNISYRFQRKDGSYIYVEDIGGFLTDAGGKAVRMFGAMKDITSRKRAEEELQKLETQLIQSQKLESIGRLAGGVAHDFNNMLAIIIGYADIMLKEISDSDPLRGKTKEIMKAAERAKDLTRQLLAFARKQTLDMTYLDLNHVVRGFERMLRRVLRENIDIKIHLSSSECFFQGDIGQIEQIILNLALNSQDAMPGGGSMIFETAAVHLDEAYSIDHEGVVAGQYVMLSMSDTGLGMTKEEIERIFEPFYTTKGLGKGTGMGLSTVYGIVKQHGGNISVYSEPDVGTNFKIYFPQIQLQKKEDRPSDTIEKKIQGKETVLIVEDNEHVRKLSCEILALHGYKVMDTPDGKTAMEIAASCDGGIDLLITDVIMPDMNGQELHQHLSQKYKALKTLFMSGYPEDIINRHGALSHGVNFIQKPFSLQDFLVKVREVLDANPAHD